MWEQIQEIIPAGKIKKTFSLLFQDNIILNVKIDHKDYFKNTIRILFMDL